LNSLNIWLVVLQKTESNCLSARPSPTGLSLTENMHVLDHVTIQDL